VDRWEFYRHMPVYSRDGRRVGRIEEVGHAVDCLHVQRGHVLIQDWYVPIEAVEDVTPRGVYLKVMPSDVLRNGWNVPPEAYLARQGATPGYEYTSPADTRRF